MNKNKNVNKNYYLTNIHENFSLNKKKTIK